MKERNKEKRVKDEIQHFKGKKNVNFKQMTIELILRSLYFINFFFFKCKNQFMCN